MIDLKAPPKVTVDYDEKKGWVVKVSGMMTPRRFNRLVRALRAAWHRYRRDVNLKARERREQAEKDREAKAKVAKLTDSKIP